MGRVLCALACALSASCASSPATVSPDDAPATASIDALADLAMCESTFADATAALGEPYRDGMVHKLRVVSWKVTPNDKREAVPLVIAFSPDGRAVDLCYDLPGFVRCEPTDQCDG